MIRLRRKRRSTLCLQTRSWTTLQPTYYRSGFFNIGVGGQSQLGADGETIELYLGDAPEPILGTINRRANSNGTRALWEVRRCANWFAAVSSRWRKSK